jgi:hypothetical protein
MQFCRPKPRKDLEPAYSSSPSSSFSSSSPHWKLSRSKHRPPSSLRPLPSLPFPQAAPHPYQIGRISRGSKQTISEVTLHLPHVTENPLHTTYNPSPAPTEPGTSIITRSPTRKRIQYNASRPVEPRKVTGASLHLSLSSQNTTKPRKN